MTGWWQNSKHHPDLRKHLGGLRPFQQWSGADLKFHPSTLKSTSRPFCGLVSLTPTPVEASIPRVVLKAGLGPPQPQIIDVNGNP